MLNPKDYVDNETNFPNPKIMILLNTLKPVIINVLNRAMNLIPTDYQVNNINDCKSTELKRQYLAFDRAVEKWNKYRKSPGSEDSRTIMTLRLMQRVYFTVQNVEAHYQVLSAFIFDEYKKIRENNEDVEQYS
jgi:hypothetical protein